MAGEKVPNWQDKRVRKLEGLIYRADFKADIARIPRGHGEEHLFAVMRLLEKYRLSSDIVPVIEHYLSTGKIRPDKVVAPIAIVSDHDGTSGPTDDTKLAQYLYGVQKLFPAPHVSIPIPPGTNKTELKSFIQSNWPYIERKLAELNDDQPKVIRRKSKPVRDAKIMKLNNLGKSASEIAEIFASDESFDEPLTPADIRLIIKRDNDI